MQVFGFDHKSELGRTSEQTMFSCIILHVTNPVIASRINMRTAFSKSDCSIVHVFQCWSSLHCQRNPVHCSAGNLLCISLPFRWQGRYGSCQWTPLKPSSLFVTEGELEALPDMWLSCCLLGNAVLCEWQTHGKVERTALESCHWVSPGYHVL